MGQLSPWIEGTALISKRGYSEQAKIRIQVTAASTTYDLQFYREMPENQIEYLRQLKLTPQDTKVLAPQIAGTTVEIGKSSLTIEGGDFSASLSRDTAAMSQLVNHLEKGIKTVIDTRVATMNEPQELVQDMQTDYMSIDAIEQLVEALMVKLGFRLPNRLIAPVTFFAACNYFAKEINVNKDDFTMLFDPRNNGLINKKVQKLLMNIEHPIFEDSDSAYSVTLD